MLGLVVAIAGLVALGAWIVAVTSGLSVIRLVPAGRRLSAWFTLGWWQFDKIRALAGPGVEPHIKRYTQAFLIFFLAVLTALVVGALTAITSQNGDRGPTAAAHVQSIPQSSLLET